MKKYLLITLLFLLSVACLAQSTAHLKFKGIPIDGNFKDFAGKLIQKGFTEVEATSDGILLSGNFMARPNVLVGVYPDPTSKVVSGVSAMIEAGDSWTMIEKEYNSIVDTYKEKYGDPSEHSEDFSPEVIDDDFYRKRSIKDGQCNYKSIWYVEGGKIIITISYLYSKNYIICAYADEQNVKALRQSIIDDI